ncbi:hypothetical protein [uncultured Paracoccus sp.]|uniref:hypothetical protein n=1 Tax=uncultured Paracoccus sp. TaxID=189685 RepID=UPI0025CC3306|nr:hypothetical protein [uncultured Paracoccus sp.]
MSRIDVHEWVWTHGYLDRPRKDRWEAFRDAREQGLSVNPNLLMDFLGLDCEAFAELFRQLPAHERYAAVKAEAKRLGLSLSAPALLDALSGRRW